MPEFTASAGSCVTKEFAAHSATTTITQRKPRRRRRPYEASRRRVQAANPDRVLAPAPNAAPCPCRTRLIRLFLFSQNVFALSARSGAGLCAPRKCTDLRLREPDVQSGSYCVDAVAAVGITQPAKLLPRTASQARPPTTRLRADQARPSRKSRIRAGGSAKSRRRGYRCGSYVRLEEQ